jgi:hypothetical protein
MKRQGLTTVILFFPVLVFSTVSSGMLLIGRAGLAEADSVIATITVGTGPYGDLYDPANGNIYVANFFSNSLQYLVQLTALLLLYLYLLETLLVNWPMTRPMETFTQLMRTQIQSL